jgi:hypothetical protein
MALFLLENRDFLGFGMIFKVPLNQNLTCILWYTAMCESLKRFG